MPTQRPPREVMTAFGITGEATRLPGGRGQTYRAGGWVLKPTSNPVETEWIAETIAGLEQDGFRVARHKRARCGAWVVSSWSVQERLDGEHRSGAWPTIIAAGDALHRSLARTPRPAFLDRRSDLWGVADRVAWGESSHAAYPEIAAALSPLFGRLDEVTAPSQLIHGDLTGNVLLRGGRPPAVIDISPYWRPVGFATAVVVVDALTWEGAGPDLLTRVRAVPEIGQFLLRAAIRRLVEMEEHRRQFGRADANALARHFAAHELLFEALSAWADSPR